MVLKLINIISTHNVGDRALGQVFNTMSLNENDTIVLTNDDHKYLRTSRVKEVIIVTQNSRYKLEDVDGVE